MYGTGGGRFHRVAFSFVLIMWVVVAAAKEAEKTLQNKILAACIVAAAVSQATFFFLLLFLFRPRFSHVAQWHSTAKIIA